MFEAHTINAQHKDLIHDVAYNYYGDRMATCSSDQFVKVCQWSMVNECFSRGVTVFQCWCLVLYQIWDQDEHGNWNLSAAWKAHSGSVWKVTWAHPEYGQVLATCSFDRTASIWEEISMCDMKRIVYLLFVIDCHCEFTAFQLIRISWKRAVDASGSEGQI